MPERLELIELESKDERLSHIHLYEFDGEPCIVAKGGGARVGIDGKMGFDAWECADIGKPMSWVQFNYRWPGLISADEYLASFSAPYHGDGNEDIFVERATEGLKALRREMIRTGRLPPEAQRPTPEELEEIFGKKPPSGKSGS